MKDELSRPVGTRDGDGDDPGVETARLFSGNAFGVQVAKIRVESPSAILIIMFILSIEFSA
jgi:hypothetical protein